MQIDGKIDEILAYIDSARTMPMSSSAIINKAQLAAFIEELRDLLPEDLQAADAVLAERTAILEEARYNAERIMADARSEQAKLIADHEITAEAQAERIKLLDAAEEGAAAIRSGVDAHVDAKLAGLERAARQLVETAQAGRADLAAAQPYHQQDTTDEVPDDRSDTGLTEIDRLALSEARHDARVGRFVPDRG